MEYLLAKFALIFLLCSAISFALGLWWARRHMKEVTVEYEQLLTSQQQSEERWSHLWQQMQEQTDALREAIAAIPKQEPVDLTDLQDSVGHMRASVARLRIPESPDLAPLEKEVTDLAQRVAILPQSAPDLSPLENEVTGLAQRVAVLPQSTPDLEPIVGAVDALSQQITLLGQQVDSVSAAPRLDPATLMPRLDTLESGIAAAAAADVDLSGVESDLQAVQRAIAGLEIPPRADLSPLTERTHQLEAAIGAIVIPEATDITPLNAHLLELQTRLSHIEDLLEQTPPTVQLQSAARLLERPAIVDNLQAISGVGPKLEQLLNQHGIYCFWQIARWQPADIEEMDQRLDAFQGRIERDAWVSQALTLQASSSAQPV